MGFAPFSPFPSPTTLLSLPFRSSNPPDPSASCSASSSDLLGCSIPALRGVLFLYLGLVLGAPDLGLVLVLLSFLSLEPLGRFDVIDQRVLGGIIVLASERMCLILGLAPSHVSSAPTAHGRNVLASRVPLRKQGIARFLLFRSGAGSCLAGRGSP